MRYIPSIAVALIAVLLLFPLLGLSPVFQVSEAREGVVVNQILNGGSILLPLRNGHIIPSKPILFHWLSAAWAVMSGNYEEFGLRAISCIAAISSVLVLYNFISSLCGVRSGLVGALILLSTYGFVHLAQDGRVDMLFCFFATASICAWLGAFYGTLNCENPQNNRIPTSRYILVGILAGLAFLTKGPLGLVLPAIVIASVAFVYRGFRGVWALLNPGWIFAIVIPLPWYLFAALKQDSAFVSRQIYFENLQRFIGADGIVAKPFWFYVPHVFGQAAPWSFVFVAYLMYLLAKKIRQFDFSVKTFAWREPISGDNFLHGVGLIWFLIGVVFFSVAVGKRRAYLLPLLPAMAMTLTVVLCRFKEYLAGRSASEVLSKPRFAAGVLVWLIALLFVVGVYSIYANPSAFSIAESFSSINGDNRFDDLMAALSVVLESHLGIIITYVVLFLALSLFFWFRGFLRARLEFVALAIFVFLQLLLVLVNTGIALKGVTHTYRGFAEEVRERVSHEQDIRFVKHVMDESFDGFFFYFRRNVVMLSPDEPLRTPGLYLARRAWFETNVANPSSNRLPFHVIASGGRLVDQETEKLVLFEVYPLSPS